VLESLYKIQLQPELVSSKPSKQWAYCLTCLLIWSRLLDLLALDWLKLELLLACLKVLD
jgi:hypothetical protein